LLPKVPLSGLYYFPALLKRHNARVQRYKTFINKLARLSSQPLSKLV
jgi:hypothetical protein